MNKVVTRFAPSPTGYLHVGNMRTGLFAWLVARHENGTFILRLEDTDQVREVEGADKHIFNLMNALHLNYDEGPDKGGPNGPYRQSERLITYAEWAKKLIESGRAYADPYTKEEVEAFRQDSQAKKKPFLYRNYRPKNPPKWDGTQALRFKSDPKAYTWHDEVLGEISAGEEAVDDFVLIKSDGYPTYNYCHIIDDYLMGITVVMRGQEYIASTPNYLNLYEALNIERPKLASMPHILGPDGKKKLSKRDGAKDVLDYLKDGYLREALINFIASLGWNDGTEQEVFDESELIEKFSLTQVQKSPARFDEKRLLWMNGQWIRKIDIDDLFNRVEPFWPKEAAKHSKEYKMEVLFLVRERLKTLADLPTISLFLFSTPNTDLSLIKDNKQLSKKSLDELKEILTAVYEAFIQQEDFSTESIQNTLNRLLDQTKEKPMVLFSLVRIATTWAPYSPDLAPSLALLGKKEVLLRLKTAIESIDTL